MSGPISVSLSVAAALVSNVPIRAGIALMAMAAFTSCAYGLWRRERLRIIELEETIAPKLRLSFAPTTEDLAPIEIYRYIGHVIRNPLGAFVTAPHDPDVVTHAVYLRLTVEAIGSKTVSNCVAHLSKLYRIGTDGGVVGDNLLPHSVPLRDNKPFDVHPNIMVIVDFICATEDDNSLRVTAPEWPVTLLHLFDRPGDFRFLLDVNGGGISHPFPVDIQWSGRWDQIRFLGTLKGHPATKSPFQERQASPPET